MNWYLEALRKYAQFDGRARRTEYWLFTLFSTLIYLFLLLIVFLPFALLAHGSHSPLATLALAPASLFAIAMIIPSVSVLVRRLHDTGRSGWWYFISFVPFVGPIVLLIFILSDSEAGTNLYGTNPKNQSYS